jgi:hypothetical protein
MKYLLYDQLVDKHPALKDAYVFDIENVARYLYSCGDKVWDFQTDFPNLAPPFDKFYMEYPMAAFDSGACGKNDKFGFLLSSRKNKGLDTWELEVTMLAPSRYFDPVATICIYIDKGGKLAPGTSDGGALIFGRIMQAYKGVFASGPPDRSPTQDATPLERVIGLYFTPVFLAISLLHCKNVEIVERKREYAPRKARRRDPLCWYHVLEIEPMRRILETEGHASTNGLKMALHICRGHFKDYRERGLFGKKRGIFWWDSHVRGTPDAGIVAKDYKVKTAS